MPIIAAVPPSIEDVRTLLEAPAIVLLLLHGVLDVIGFLRGWVVPGWLYRKSEARTDSLEASIKALTSTIEEYTDEAWDGRDRRRAAPARRGGGRA